MSGNGAYVPGNQLGQLNLGAAPGSDLSPLYLPAGHGGGCVTSDPFKNMSVNLGPVSLPLVNGSLVSNGNGFAYNPRCLKCDLTDAINQQYANASAVVSNILDHDNVWDFQMTMQGVLLTRRQSGPGLLHFSRRPGVLLAPLADRQSVVDLAESEREDSIWRGGYLGYGNILGCASQCKHNA